MVAGMVTSPGNLQVGAAEPVVFVVNYVLFVNHALYVSYPHPWTALEHDMGEAEAHPEGNAAMSPGVCRLGCRRFQPVLASRRDTAPAGSLSSAGPPCSLVAQGSPF